MTLNNSFVNFNDVLKAYVIRTSTVYPKISSLKEKDVGGIEFEYEGTQNSLLNSLKMKNILDNAVHLRKKEKEFLQYILSTFLIGKVWNELCLHDVKEIIIEKDDKYMVKVINTGLTNSNRVALINIMQVSKNSEIHQKLIDKKRKNDLQKKVLLISGVGLLITVSGFLGYKFWSKKIKTCINNK